MIIVMFFILTFIMLLIGITIVDNRLYCFLWEHKLHKTWAYYIKHINDFKIVECSRYKFILESELHPDIHICMWYPFSPYHYSAIFNSEDCIATSFDRYHSRKMSNIIENIYKISKHV